MVLILVGKAFTKYSYGSSFIFDAGIVVLLMEERLYKFRLNVMVPGTAGSGH